MKILIFFIILVLFIIYQNLEKNIFNFRDINILHNDPDFIIIYNVLDYKIFRSLQKIVNNLYNLDKNRSVLHYYNLDNDLLKNILYDDVLIDKIKELLNVDNIQILDDEQKKYSYILRFIDDKSNELVWHKDTTSTKNKKLYVMLLILENKGFKNNLSHQQNCRNIDNVVDCIDTPPNSLLIYEGGNILHRTTKIYKNEHRIVLQSSFLV